MKAIFLILCFFTELQNIVGLVLTFPPVNISSSSEITNNGLYARWLNPARVLYYIDESYNAEELSIIQGALIVITLDMNLCIQFQEYNPDVDHGEDFIYISKTLNDGTSPPTCVTFVGRLLHTKGQGQKMVIRGGPNGCLTSVREVIKVLVNVLGLRNEYRRPDRDQYIKVMPDNLQPEFRESTLLTPYNSSDVTYVGFPFDYHSVTMPAKSKYAMNNTTIWDFPDEMSITYLDRLSHDDCAGLCMIYSQCNVQYCRDPYNLTPRSSASTTEAVTPMTTPTSSTGMLFLMETTSKVQLNVSENATADASITTTTPMTTSGQVVVKQLFP